MSPPQSPSPQRVGRSTGADDDENASTDDDDDDDDDDAVGAAPVGHGMDDDDGGRPTTLCDDDDRGRHDAYISVYDDHTYTYTDRCAETTHAKGQSAFHSCVEDLI